MPRQRLPAGPGARISGLFHQHAAVLAHRVKKRAVYRRLYQHRVAGLGQGAHRGAQAGDHARLRAQLSAAAQGHMPVALFGGGHVGAAIARLLGTLPVRTHWIDSRDEIFPQDLPLNLRSEHSEPVPGSHVLIMSFSHAEDLDIVAACLKRRRERADLPFIGLIGSQTKWATFRHRLEARGFRADELAAVTCPIGVPGVVGKEPEVIAVAVAAQLLQQRVQG